MIGRTIILASLAWLASSCTTMSEAVEFGKLAGTSWKLVSFSSMDDAQGVVRPLAGQKFSLSFDKDGQIFMQLDCNRGSASYDAEASSAGSGTISIGPIAATRALCPEPRIGELIAAQLPNASSYILTPEKLTLALKMDGGIFEFESIK